MILTCALCKTHYLVQANLFAMGPKQVRCGHCHHSWMTGSPEENAETQESAQTASPPILLNLSSVQKSFERWKPSRQLRRMMAAIGIVLILSWLVLDRQEIAQNRPFLEKLYHFAGL